jgi:hypothetical protein
MDNLLKKLKQIKELMDKAQDVPPSPKGPKPPSAAQPQAMDAPSAPKPGQATSKKDPMKMAQQLKDPKLKDQATDQAKKMKDVATYNKGGQWQLK